MKRSILGSSIATRMVTWPKDIVQADSPHAAELDAQLARATEAIAYKCSGNVLVRSYPFISRSGAIPSAISNNPRASISALSTWTGFDLSMDEAGVGNAWTHAIDFPFRLSEGFRAIGAIVTLVTNSDVSLAARIKTNTLAGHTVAETVGGAHVFHYSTSPEGIQWQLASNLSSGALRAYSAFLWVDNPAVESTRRILVVPQVQCPDGANAQISNGLFISVWLKSIMIMDMPDYNVVPW